MTRSPHNLPVQPTPLIGREREVHVVCMLLTRADVRLVTLTGVAGTGKTRVGLQVAAESMDGFAAGVAFVGLAPIRDPALVAPSIGQMLGVRDQGSRPILESLTAYLQDRRILLVLDNFEQVLPAAPVVAELLAACPELKILVTSRAALHLRGEHEYPVTPLALPDPGHGPLAREIAASAAVALFVERATDVRPDFRLSDENAAAVAEICRRLDGLPLALELAAPRVKLFSPQAMLGRLERRLPLLTGGARDLPARQQTLRDAIAWSYDLLTPDEQVLFRRLGVFVGGFSVEAAEAIHDAAGRLSIDVLEGIGSLVDQSMVRQEGEGPGREPRFGMLETIREYALEELDASGEAETTRRAHAAFFLGLADRAEPKLFGREQVTWLRRLHLEHDNLRAVLGRSRTGEIPVEIGLQLAGRLEWFWRGFVTEGRDWTEAMLRLPGATTPTSARAKALHCAAVLALWQGDYSAARTLAQESATIFRATSDLQAAGRVLMQQGVAELAEGNHPVARGLMEESVSLARRVGDRWGLAVALGQLGAVYRGERDYAAAFPLYEESIAIAREIGDQYLLGLALAGLAFVARARGDQAQSEALWRETLGVTSEFEDHWVLPRAIAGLAGVAVLAGDYGRAACLFGVEAGLREASGSRDMPFWRSIMDLDATTARAAIGDQAFAAAWAKGRAMSLEQAVAYGLSVAGPDIPARPPDHRVGAQASPLSPREAEVAALIAQGLTNHQIGSTLVISERTVDAHVRHILDKLGFTSRAHVAAWAVRQGLVDDGAPRPDR